MPRTQCRAIRSVLLTILLGASSTAARAQNIDPANDGSQYAWGENVGWVNFQPSFGPGVTVTDAAVTGLAWGENVGWINLSPTAGGGVVNDGAGHLSGFAWGENVGWINFAPTGGGVSINACGEFNGTAWGENIGWIGFRSSGAFPFKITTSWVPSVDATPPVTSATGAGAAWSNTDVSLTLSATDCGTGVREVHYTLDSDPEVVTQGASATVTITSEGIHSFSYFSVDNAGNAEPLNVLTIRVDKTAPVITLSSPADGAAYLINQNVAADFAAADSLSGIAALVSTVADGSPIATSTLGVKTFSVSAIDQAGNSASVTHTYSVGLPTPPPSLGQFTALAAPNSPTTPGCVVPSPGGINSTTPIWAQGSCNLPGPGGGTATGLADARQGQVAASAAAAKPSGGNDVPMSASGTAIFTGQVTFTPLPGVTDPGTIPVKLNLAYTGTHGPGVWFASSDIQGSVVVGGVGGNVLLRLRSVRFFDDTGNTGSDSSDFVTLAPGLLQTPEINVPVNSPSTIQFSLEVSAGAQRDGSASAEASLAFPTGMDVFVLPPGFTANAPASFLFNNRFLVPNVPPTPSSIAVGPPNPSMNVGQTQPFTATGTFGDGSTQVLSSGTTLPSGVVSWWPGDGNASDASDGYPGVTLGGVAFAPGMVGQAFSFDGVDADVWIGAKPNLDVGIGDGLTIDAWIFPSGPTAGGPLGSGPIVEYGNQDGAVGVNLWQYHRSADPLTGLLVNLVDVSGAFHILEATGITQDAWNHVAVAYSKTTGVATLYVDGVAVASQSIGSFTPRTSTDLHIGRRLPGAFGGASGVSFQGLIDEVEIYNRALSASEVQALFDAGSASRCQPLPGCVSWGSSDPAVAPIDQTGVATGLSPGQTTITATSRSAPAIAGSTGLTVVGPSDLIFRDGFQ